MHRRTFLRSTALTAGAVLLGSCGGTGDPAATASPTGSFDAIAAVAPEADRNFSVLSASFEQLAGERPYAFGLQALDNSPVTGADAEVWAVPLDGGERSGPYRATFHEVPDQPFGAYLARVNLEPGSTSLVVVTSDGGAGEDVVAVVDPANSKLPAPGVEAIAVSTPTVADPLGYERVCSDDPACSMHDVSLAQALAEGRPVMLMFATPAYCATTACGPSVSVLQEVKASRDWGDTAFIHVEIYRDAGQTIGDPVTAWRLPSEPWLFTVGADGVIANRADGPLLTLKPQLAEMAEAI